LYTTTGIGVCRDSLPRVCCVVFRFCRAVVVWLFAHDMKHKQLILADYFDARRFRSVRASKRILRHVNRISGIKVTGKIKMEVLANRIAEISHMSRCTSDAAVYRPTLKIILHLRVLSRLQHSYRIPICTFAGTYSEAGGPYSKDCRRTYSEDCDRIRKTAYRIRKPTARKSRP
jgi:sigma54-dependent transcription regulator